MFCPTSFKKVKPFNSKSKLAVYIRIHKDKYLTNTRMYNITFPLLLKRYVFVLSVLSPLFNKCEIEGKARWLNYDKSMSMVSYFIRGFDHVSRLDQK